MQSHYDGCMENGCGIGRILWLLIALIGCAVCSFASDPQLPTPIASWALPETHSSGQRESNCATVAFSSETSIAVGLCREDYVSKECSLVLVRWEGGTIQPLAQTTVFDSDLSINPASGGQILARQPWLQRTIVYSADLSRVRDVPKHLSRVSPSGKTAAEQMRGEWKLYRLNDSLEPLREGTGDLRSVSDEAVVIQEGKAIRVETLDGRQVGSFFVSDEVLGFHAGLLGNSKVYLPDCRRTVRAVDFEGNTQLKMHQAGLCGLDDTRSSADGRRILFDFTDHKTSGLRHMLESIGTIITLGMEAPEDFNREVVRVFDIITGKSCFEWYRTFPMTYSQVRSAAISPSGEFVAIAAGNTLSIYRLPPVCEAKTATLQK